MKEKATTIQNLALEEGNEAGARTISQITSKLRSALPLILERRPVTIAYLFGSVTIGKMNPFSDVDIALFVNEGLSPLEKLKLILSIQLDLADQCDIPNADVRIINDAPLVFQGKVVNEGLLVFARN